MRRNYAHAMRYRYGSKLNPLFPPLIRHEFDTQALPQIFLQPYDLDFSCPLPVIKKVELATVFVFITLEFADIRFFNTVKVSAWRDTLIEMAVPVKFCKLVSR